MMLADIVCPYWCQYDDGPCACCLQIQTGMHMIAKYVKKHCSKSAAFSSDTHALLPVAATPGAQYLEALRRIQRVVGGSGGSPIAEQLEVVASLPIAEQMSSTKDILRSWMRGV